jgi:RHS repeat-associated protein
MDGNGNVNTDPTFIGNMNPIRWKSQYYDIESGFYYIDGKYYSPEIKQYLSPLSPESMMSMAGAINFNPYSVCLTNPVNVYYNGYSIATNVPLSYPQPYKSDFSIWWGEYGGWVTAIASGPLATALYALQYYDVIDSKTALIIQSVVNIIVGIILLFTPAAPLGAGMIGAGIGGIVGGLISEAVGGRFETGWVIGSIIGGILGDLAYKGITALKQSAMMKAGCKGDLANSACFVAGTLVLCLDDDGNECHKPIEDVAVGDLVWAYDEETGESGWKEVVRLFRNETSSWICTDIEIDGEIEQIKSTAEHPYYVLNADANREIVEFEGRDSKDFDGQWIAAKNLKAGDRVVLSNGKTATIKKVETENLAQPETTYNLEVADFHTYYVGEKSVLVHNTCPPKSPKQLSKSEIKKFNAEAYKETYVDSNGARFDIFIDTANNGKIWLGNKSQKIWVETYEYLPDLFNGGW